MAAELVALELAVTIAIETCPEAKNQVIAVFRRHLDVLLERGIPDKDVAALSHEALERRLAWLEALPAPD